MPPKGKRKAKDTGEGPTKPKKARRKADEFADQVPYIVRKKICGVFGQSRGYHDSGSDDETPDDGFDAAMAVEEQMEEKVEHVAMDVEKRIARGEQVSTGIIMGDWKVYSPNFMNLRNHPNDPGRMVAGEPRDWRTWSTGSLKIGPESVDPSIISTRTVGMLRLDGIEHDWHIYMDVPEFASLQAVPCQAVRHIPAQPSRPDSADEVFGKREARVGVFFFGEGCLKIKVPAIYLGGKKQWNRWVTLFGVREAEQEA